MGEHREVVYIEYIINESILEQNNVAIQKSRVEAIAS